MDSRRLIRQRFYFRRVGNQKVPQVAQVLDEAVKVGLVNFVTTVGQHVPEQTVHQPQRGVQPLVFCDKQGNPLMGQLKAGVLAKLRIHPSWLS